jgi:hypothetical protein
MKKSEIAQTSKQGKIIPWPKKPKKQAEGWHPLINLRDPKIAHDVLSAHTFREVRICLLCQRHKNKETCPHKEGEEPFGECPSFILDEDDVEGTEARMMNFLNTPRTPRGSSEQTAA